MKSQYILPKTPSHKMSIKNTAGFSLIELVTIMAIIGVLTTVAFSGLTKWVPNFRLKGAAQELYSNMQKAKVEAVKRNKNVGIQFTTTVCPPEGGGYTVFLDENASKSQDAGEGTLFNVAMPKGTCLSATGLGSDYYGFTQQGLAVGAAAGDVTLAHVSIGRTYTMTMSIAGAVNIK